MDFDLSITNCIAATGDRNPVRRGVEDIDTVMLHRIEAKNAGIIADSAAEIAEFFRNNRAVIGSPYMPYPLVVTRAGVCEQALDLQTSSPHAWQWNTRALGVAVVGDFRYEEPTLEQAACLNLLMPLLVQAFTEVSDGLVGHTEMPKATRWTNHDCPGLHLNPMSLRTLTAANIRTPARTKLRALGMVI